MNIAPPIVAKFFDNNGAPLANGRVFTYISGTATKQATYRDQAGTPNANPIPLNARGECNLCLDPALAYTVTVAPPGTDDPPTSAFTPVDNVYGPINSANLTAEFIGAITNQQTPAEQAAGVTPTNYAYPSGHAWRYGATGDGSTDDTIALQNWAKSASDLYLPKAAVYYKITSEITLYSNTRIHGDGFGSQIRQVTAEGRNLHGVSVNNIVIKDIGIYGTSSTTDIGAITLTSCTNVVVERCDIQNNSLFGIKAGNCQQLRVRDCYIHNWITVHVNAAGIGFQDGCSWCTADHNVINGDDGSQLMDTGILVQNTDDTADVNEINIVSNLIRGQSAYAIAAYRVGSTHNITRIQIIGNQILNINGAVRGGTAGAGVYIQGAKGVVIEGNYINDTNQATTTTGLAPGAIGVNSVRGDITITGNTIDAPNWAGIYLVTQADTTSQATISGNTIRGHGRAAIWITDHGNVSITGNRTYTAGNVQSLLIADPTSPLTGYQISNNKFESGTTSAVCQITKCNSVTFTGNSALASGIAPALYIDTCNRVEVSGNDLYAPSNTNPAFQLISTTLCRIMGNTLTNTAGNAIFTTSGTCTGSLYDRTNYNSSLLFVNGGTGCKIILDGATPGSGTHVAGDTAWFTAPAAAAAPGAVCTTGGSPGTWKTMAVLAA